MQHSLILSALRSCKTFAMVKFKLILLFCFLNTLALLLNHSALAEEYDVDPQTGYRMDRYRAPVPKSIPGGTTVDTPFVMEQHALGNMVFIDVLPPKGMGADPLEGYWLITEPRHSIAGTHWLPEVGRGFLEPEHADYFERNLKRLSVNDKNQPILFFCTADCWQSWNAAKRAISWGYANVYWYPNGSDGWLEQGNALTEIAPVNFINDTTPHLFPANASIELIGKEQNTSIGTVQFKNLPDGTANFSIDITGDDFSDHFLSMRPFRCITGTEDWYCHLAYPYELNNSISADDFTNLEYQLLFIQKKKNEFGIDAWNGIYYKLALTDTGAITGKLMQGDLNVLSSPPEPYSHPIDLNEFFGDEAHKQRYPALTIKSFADK